jgi:hypothetical protein
MSVRARQQIAIFTVYILTELSEGRVPVLEIPRPDTADFEDMAEEDEMEFMAALDTKRISVTQLLYARILSIVGLIAELVASMLLLDF